MPGGGGGDRDALGAANAIDPILELSSASVTHSQATAKEVTCERPRPPCWPWAQPPWPSRPPPPSADVQSVGPGPARRAPDRRLADARPSTPTLAQQRLTRKAWRARRPASPTRATDGFSPRAYRAPGQRRAAGAARPPRARAAPRPARRPPRASGAAPAREPPPPPRSRRSPPASPAATRAPTPATASTASTSSRCRRGQSVGGTGNPAAAGEAEQNQPRGAALRARGRLAVAGLRPLVVSRAMALRDEFPVLAADRVPERRHGRADPARRRRAGAARSSPRELDGGPRCGRTSSAAASCRTTCAPATRG